MNARKILVTALLAGMVCRAFAGDVLLFGERERPDARTVAAILATDAAEPTRVRAIRLFDATATHTTTHRATISPTPDAESVDASPSVRKTAAAAKYSSFALPLRFNLDSAHVAPEMADQLDAVADGIRRASDNSRIVIEGHTDASGDTAHNRALSYRRAGIVKAYLVQVHGIAPERLTAVGIGESRPLPGRSPYAAANRRVEFRAVSA